MKIPPTGSKSWKLTLATVGTTLTLAIAGSLGYDIDPQFVELLIFTALGVGGIGAANAAHKRQAGKKIQSSASMPKESNRIADTETKLRELEKQHEYHYTDTHKPLNAKIESLENKLNVIMENEADGHAILSRFGNNEDKIENLKQELEKLRDKTHRRLIEHAGKMALEDTVDARITDLQGQLNNLVNYNQINVKNIDDLSTQNQINVKNITRQNEKLETLDKHLADFRLHMDDLDKAIQDNKSELNQHYKDYLTQKEIEDLIQHHEANK